MPIKQNVGSIDSIIRKVLGIGAIYYGFISPQLVGDPLFANLLGFLGVIVIISSLFRYCPLYVLGEFKKIFNAKSKKTAKDPSLRTTKKYFFITFSLLTVTTIIIFGLVAYHSAVEISQERENSYTNTLFKTHSDFLVSNANVDDVQSLQDVAASLKGFLGQIFAIENGYLIHPLSIGSGMIMSTADIQRLSILTSNAGTLDLPEHRRHWQKIPLPNSRYTLFVTYDMPLYETQLLDAFNSRLFVASTILFYFYVWGTLIGTRYISKKFDLINSARMESEALNTLLLNSTAEAIYGVDTDGNCTFCNPATLQLLGYSDVDDLLGKNVHNLMHHSHPDGSEYPIEDCPMNRVLKQGLPVHEDNEVFWRADNTCFPVEYWGHPIVQNDQAQGMVMTFLDITKRKVAEAERLKLSSVVEQSKDLIVLTDNHAVISYTNPAFSDITGFSYEDALGKEISILNQALTENDEHEQIFDTLKQGDIYQDSFVNYRKNGDAYYLDLSVYGLKNQQGELESIVYTGRDVTEKIDTEETIRQSESDKIEAEAANQSKSIFLANMSHEIRTPMTAIIGFAESLLDDDITEIERRDAVKTIIRGGQHLTRIINDILDLSKIEANRVDIESIPIDLLELLAEINKIANIQVNNKHIDFIDEYQFPLPRIIHSDPTRLKQILLNLVTNAVKFTDSGHVELTLSHDPQEQLIFFKIKDTGIGLSDEQQRKLFNPFSQAESSTTRRYGGTGLGLHISKQLSERMGGSITVESQLNVGSTFTLSIASGLKSTLAEDELITTREQVIKTAHEHDHVYEDATHGAKILISEDSKVSQALLKRLFKDSNIEIEIVDNGERALERAFETEFDLVLTDIHMPIMDGLEATQKMRDRGFKKPIIAITANVMKNDITNYYSAGCDAVISKPIEKDNFFTVINKYLTDKQYKPKATTTEIPQLSGEILVAEDNPDNQRLITMVINKTGANLSIAEDGLSAIEHTLSKDYHIILMDINMPLMNGLEATKKLRKAGYTLPIYALTADTDKDKVTAFEEAGYDGYLSKPLDNRQLYSVLEKYLPCNSKPEKLPTYTEGKSAEMAYEEVDEEILSLMILFAERLPPMIEQIDTAIKEQDWETAGAVIHNIKGTAGSFGHPKLTLLAGVLSNIIKNADYDDAPIAFADVVEYAKNHVTTTPS